MILPTPCTVAGGVQFAYLSTCSTASSTRGEAGLYFSLNQSRHHRRLRREQQQQHRQHQRRPQPNPRLASELGPGHFVSPHLFANLYNTWSSTDSTYAMNRRTLNYWSCKTPVHGGEV
ncbi:MAG: hypothetical protein IPM98_11640 [Lewinellaceae bacterium]|nr:hypothetical protein [Lewinellaceae bacterium]